LLLYRIPLNQIYFNKQLSLCVITNKVCHTVTGNALTLFTKILTIKNCRKCKTKIKKSFTKIQCKNCPNFTCKTTMS
jgi:hypothetical protein